MKKTFLFSFVLLVLLLTGCSREAEFINPEASDFLAWTKEYVDAGDALSAGGSVKEYKKAISDIVGEDLLAESMEAANQTAADFEFNGKVYSGEEKLRFVFGRDANRVEIVTELSPVYDDLNPERDFFRYVIVKQSITVFDENDEVIDGAIPERNRINLQNFWFQKLDERWILYNIEKMRLFPDEDGEHTREEFNGELIPFTHYKSYEINLIPIE